MKLLGIMIWMLSELWASKVVASEAKPPNNQVQVLRLELSSKAQPVMAASFVTSIQVKHPHLLSLQRDKKTKSIKYVPLKRGVTWVEITQKIPYVRKPLKTKIKVIIK